MARIVTFGHLLVEDILLPDGRVVPDRLGGDAIYAAAGARIWLDDVVPVARVGMGFPPGLRAALDEAGLAAGLVASERNAIRLGVRWGVEDATRFSFAEGSGTYEELAPVSADVPAGLDSGLEAVHVAPLPFDAMEALVRWARPRARLVTVDPHYQHVDGNTDAWRPLLPLIDAFLPSREEARDLLGGWPGPEEAALELVAMGADLVVLKLGAEGSLAYRASAGTIARAAPAAREEIVDPTGSGDAFCGGFVAGLVDGCSLEESLRRGAISASVAGAGHGAAHMLAGCDSDPRSA